MDSMNLAPYIDNERLADYAVSCARLLKSTGTQSGAEAALRLHESIRELRRCRDTLHRRYTGAPAVVKASWTARSMLNAFIHFPFLICLFFMIYFPSV